MTRRERESIDLRFWIQLGLAWFGVAMITVWSHVKAVGLERDVREMHREADRLTYENSRLQMQINQWMTPSHLESMAKKDYGMGPVDSTHIIGLSR